MLITQSLFYGHPEAGSSQIEWAYASQSLDQFAEPGEALVAPINTNFGMANWFKALNSSEINTSLQASVFDLEGFYLPEDRENPTERTTRRILPNGNRDIAAHLIAGPDVAGAFSASSTTEESHFSGEMLRVFPKSGGGIGYVMRIPATSVSRAITANSQKVSASLDESTEINLTLSNQARDSFGFWISERPRHGRLSGRTPNIRYIPNPQYVGPDQFSFRAYDGRSSSAEGIVSIDVNRWEAPIGVPEASFGLIEKAPSPPSPWTAQAEGFYYVDRNHESAVDTGNEFGTPDRPRLTIPRSLAPGSVVTLNGRYDYLSEGFYETISSSGTASAPIFIRGQDPENKPQIPKLWFISGSHIILENLEFLDEDEVLERGDTGKLVVVAPAHHVSIRYNEITGNYQEGGVSIIGFLGQETNNIVVYGNRIHDIGRRWGNGENEPRHGVSVGLGANNIWIASNDFWHIGGSAVEVDAGSLAQMPSTNNIFVGYNSASNNRHPGYWVKHASDVVISQNSARYHRPHDDLPGAGMGFEYGPQRVWFLYNEIHNSEIGIASTGENGPGGNGAGDDVYLVGNIIRDISNSGDSASGPAKDGAAIRLADNGPIKFVVNNTIDQVVAGVTYHSGHGPVVIANNSFTNVETEQIYIEHLTTASASFVHNNLFPSPALIKWGSFQPYTIESFQAAFAGQCFGCVYGQASFVNLSRNDFRLAEDSSARENGDFQILERVHHRFLDLYGIPINFDYAKKLRTGASVDIGAYQFEQLEQ